MKRFLAVFIVIFLLCSCASPASSSDASEPLSTTVLSNPTGTPVPSSLKVLFLGNSYTYGNDLPDLFAELASSGGHSVEVGMVAEGGWQLSDHLESTETLERLQSTKWDFVVLQEQSQIPSFEAYRNREMLPAARELVSKIRKIGATPIFFLTWGHEGGWPERGMNDYESMQIQIEKGYQEIAQQLDLPIAPVGSAWHRAVQQYPELNLWREDGSHPSKQGTYLAACVFYAEIFHESPEGLTFHAGLSTETAQTLQSIASKTSLDFP